MKEPIQNKNPFTFSNSVVLFPLFFVLFLWVVFWIELKFNFNFAHFGIYPRENFGFKGVFLSTFIHGSFSHLTNNSLALLILLSILRFFYRKQFFIVVVIGIFFSGLGTWLMGRPSYHIGASGLIYALVSFIFFKGIFTRYYRLMAVSFLIVLLYGGTLWYMFPDVDTSISWEGHLSGFVTGLAIALLLKTPQFAKQPVYDWEHPNFNPEDDEFIKHFDKEGKFNPQPKITEEEKGIQYYFTSSIRVIYDYLGKKY